MFLTQLGLVFRSMEEEHGADASDDEDDDTGFDDNADVFSDDED